MSKETYLEQMLQKHKELAELALAATKELPIADYTWLDHNLNKGIDELMEQLNEG